MTVPIAKGPKKIKKETGVGGVCVIKGESLREDHTKVLSNRNKVSKYSELL